jgi:CHAT domain-containing protein/tetratricopeptide (TPR) repeat protein
MTTLVAEVEALRRSEPAAALKRLEEGFVAAARRADAAGRGTLWRLRAHVQRSLLRTREAAASYRRAAAWYAKAGDRREQGRCSIGLVDSLMFLGRYSEARRAAASGRRLLEKSGDRAALARLLNNEGNLWHRLDLPERALESYRASVRALERVGDASSARMIGNNVGNCLSLLGRCDEARKHYSAARDAQYAADNANEALRAEYGLAYLDFLELKHELALAGLAHVRDEAEKRGFPPLVALARLDRAEILLRLGAHEDALKESREAVVACARLGLRYETAKAELFGALASFRLGQPDAARLAIERALEMFDTEGNQVWIGETLLGLATLWSREGNPRAAAALIAAARRRFAAVGDRERDGCAAAIEVRALLACGAPKSAAARLRSLTRIPERRRSPRMRHLALAAGAALAKARGEFAEARKLLQRAADESERLAARILDEEWRATFWGEWGWPHQELAVLEISEGRIAEALEALEAGRGRALVDPAQSRRATGLLPASVRRWTASRVARDRSNGKDGRRGGDEPTMAVLEPALRNALAARAPREIRALEVARSLPVDAMLFDWFTHEGTLGAITVRRDGMTARARLVGEERLASLVGTLLFSLRSAAYTPAAERTADIEFQRQIEEIASLVLWPLLRTTPSAFALVPTGPLARLPWAAMPLPDGRLLCEAGEIVVVPGLRLGLARAQRMHTPAAPLVVAVDAGELAAVQGETAAVLAAFPGATLLSGADATADRFLELAPAADWIHFAGHGGWRADAPEASGLRLADRWLLAGELADISLSARWVTLSACHTARALVRPGEEWFGLARAFLLAGSASVVAAQWDVDDVATSRLMSDLYSRLASGTALARALADAQAARALAGEHAIDWAGFAVLGGPRVLADTSNRRSDEFEDGASTPQVIMDKTSFTETQLVDFQQVPGVYTEVDLTVRGAAPLHSLQLRRHA